MEYESLHLYEETLLLALHDDRGTVHFGVSVEYAIAGALLAELLLSGSLALVGSGKDAKVIVADSRPSGDALVDECLALVEADARTRKAGTWVQRFAGVKRLKHRAAEGLVRAGTLRVERDRVLLLFERTRYPGGDRRPEHAAILRLKRTILGSGRDVEPRTLALLGLAHHTGLLKRVIDKRLLREHGKRIEQMLAGEHAGQATQQALEAMQAAIAVAAILPAVSASASSG